MDAMTDAAHPPAKSAAPKTFYEFDGEVWTPTKVCQSPWRPDAVNGMCLAGLMAHAAEQVPAPAPMLPTRINIDILRPVPFGPCTTRIDMIRPGKKLDMFDVVLVSNGEDVIRARVLRIRESESPGAEAPIAHPPPELLASAPSHFHPDDPMGEMIDTRVVASGRGFPSTGALWTRYRDLAPGVPASGIVQAAMLSDFGGGISKVADIRKYTFANLDISMHLVRRPVGEWMLVEATSLIQGTGVGVSNMILADRRGEFGRAHQTLFVESR